MRIPISLIVATLCAVSHCQPTQAFPTINKDRFTKSFSKEKLPPPLVIRDKWALLIGVSKYQDSNIPAVRTTTANMAVLSKALKDAATGKFADDHVTTLYGVQATKKYAEFLATEGWLIKKALPNDLILIYACGRAKFTNDDAILCTYDTNAASIEPTGLSLNEVLTEVHRRTQSKNIVCVADLEPVKEEAAPQPELWKNLSAAAKVTILAANAPGLPSYQFNSMGTVFTGYFVDGLQNTGGTWPLEQVAMHVCQNTEADVHTQLSKYQRPQFVPAPENHEISTVSLGVPIKGNPNSTSHIAIGHPLDELALNRPDLLPHAPHPVSAEERQEGAKDIPHKPVQHQGSAPNGAAKKNADADDDDDDVQDIDYSAYMAKMKKDIQAKWKPPKGLEQRKVAVTFSINRDGSITDGSVVESSGVDSIDKSALEALHDASPIDPLPKGAPKSVQIRYQFDWKVQ